MTENSENISELTELVKFLGLTVSFLVLLVSGLVILVARLLKKTEQTVAEVKKLGARSPVEQSFSNADFDEIIEKGNAVLEGNPNAHKAHWWNGKAYFAKGMWEESLFHFTETIRLDPSWRKDAIDPFIEIIREKLPK